MERYFRQGLASSTQRTYSSAQKRYLEFCNKHSLPPLPVHEHQLCQFVSFLGDQSLAYSSLKGYLSAIRNLQITYNYPDPNISRMPKLEQVLRGIKRQNAAAQTKRERLPITPDILVKLRAVWERENTKQDNIMLWAVSSLCFFGFFRAGELTIPSENSYDPQIHLSYGDIAIDSPNNPTIMKVHLKDSKTDPGRKGVDIFVGRTYNKLCPIAAVLAYLAKRGNAPGFLFKFENGKPLTKAKFVASVKGALTSAGVDSTKYAGHSFRIGAATTAHLQGIEDATIKMLGRWESSAYLLYIRTPRDQLASLSSILSKH